MAVAEKLVVGMIVSTIERIVEAKLVPVSASLTGKTLILLR
jgi:hypothetical protein